MDHAIRFEVRLSFFPEPPVLVANIIDMSETSSADTRTGASLEKSPIGDPIARTQNGKVAIS
jgi:hypothetical protein